MTREECMSLVHSRIMKKEILSLEDISAIKAVVYKTDEYLDRNDVIPKESAVEIFSFIHFFKKLAINAKTFTSAIYGALKDGRGSTIRSPYVQSKTLNVAFADYVPKEYLPEDIPTLEAWIEEYSDSHLQEMLMGRYDLKMIEKLDDLNWESALVYKPMMHAIVSDYIYAAEMLEALNKTEAHYRFNKGYDYYKQRDEERTLLYSNTIMIAKLEIRENYLWNKKFENLGLINECLHKMREIMQVTEQGMIDTLDFFEILDIYGTGTQEMFRFNYYEENMVSIDYFADSIKELINHA